VAIFWFTDTQTVRTMTMTYKIQIDDEVRDATADEAAVIDAQHAYAKTRKDAQTAKDAARQTVLDKLGLTADEAQALLG